MSSGKTTVKDLPRSRVELHVHLDGAVRHETIWELAKQKGLKLPGNGTFHDLRKALIIRDPINLQHFLKPFLIFTPCFTGDMKAIERAAYEFCEDEAQNGVIYVEARYSPHFWLSSEDKRGQIEELSEVVRAVNRGFERGENDFGVKAQSILCALNGTHTVRDVFELCKKFKGEGVVGLDLAMNSMDKSEKYVEVPLNPEEIAVYEEARKCGIHRTLHAGEAGGPEMVQRAVNNYQTERVGHGYHVLQDESIYQACLHNNIHFETCPWSSFLTGAVPLNTPKHPIVRFAEDNANFSLNTDDPTITGHSLNGDYALTSTWGLNEVHVIRATLNAARSSFLPEDERNKLVKRILKVCSIEE